MRIHFEKDDKQFEGEIDEYVYDEKLFPIFKDHLKPVKEKKFYTKEQLPIKKLTKPQSRTFGWEVIFGCTAFGILLGITIVEWLR